VRVERNREPVKIRFETKFLDDADRVDVPLDEMPAQAAVGA
jgi:hypothetical protein